MSLNVNKEHLVSSGGEVRTAPHPFVVTLNRGRMVLVLIGIAIFFATLQPLFFRFANFNAIGLTISILGLVSIGQTLCILTRGFDLSVGSVAAFSGILCAYLYNAGIPLWQAVIVTLVCGLAIGCMNGLFITKTRINPFITTLATMSIFQGFVFIISRGYSITVQGREFRFLGTHTILGVPLPIIMLVAAYCIFHIVMRYTVFGRYLYCIGGNPESARLSGINVHKYQTIVYAISGFLAAFGGIVLASRMGAAQTTAGGDYALQSVSAVLLGGTTLAGGEGGVMGSLVGVAIIGVLRNGLIMINMPSYYQFVATGAALLVAVLIHMLKR